MTGPESHRMVQASNQRRRTTAKIAGIGDMGILFRLIRQGPSYGILDRHFSDSATKFFGTMVAGTLVWNTATGR